MSDDSANTLHRAGEAAITRSSNDPQVCIVEFLRALGSQSGVSAWQTYSGRLALARSFIRQLQQCSYEELLS